jgi:uncharacterized protein YdaL
MKNRNYTYLIFLFLIVCIPAILFADSKVTPVIQTVPERIIAVRFDPSYYYDLDLEVDALCEALAQQWSESGINLVYVKVYDPLYGAIYKTNYPLNIQTDYGRLDLLSAVLKSCHERHISVFTWIPAFQHKQVWKTHPEWRMKDKKNHDYQSEPDHYPLCTRHEAYRKWWIGFIGELVENYPELDGFDIAEPVVTWKYDEGCFCDLCREAYENHLNTGGEKQTLYQIRSEPLTQILEETTRFLHDQGKAVSITTVVSAHKNGLLYASEEQRLLTGFDLNGVLNAADKPDIINAELIWQQWADAYNNAQTFTPQWTREAVHQMVGQVAGKADLIAHVEITPFGKIKLNQDQFFESIQHAFKGGAQSIDFYNSHQADEQRLWPELAHLFQSVYQKRVVVYYDPEGENDARQLNVLLNHFNTKTTRIPLERSFSPPDDSEVDVIFYVGSAYRSSLPSKFLRYIIKTNKTVCWINYNLFHLGERYLSRLGFQYQGLDEDSRYEVQYKGTDFTKLDSSITVIRIDNQDRCQVLATAKADKAEIPYILRSGHFWYVSDLPLSYVTEGGRHIVFGDLLHDILEEDHQEQHLALVRIEDTNPQSSPEHLREIADFLSSRKIPFAVGLTPFYLDPSTNTIISLSDRPEFGKALRYMVSKGGTIVLHGCTHQYRGQSCIDYEFWDGIADQPLFEDSEEYVQSRIEKALDECLKNGLYPLIWETPHYAASLFDYQIISRYFSTSYERRQTMDVLGSDQLLPFITRSLFTNTVIIPENLGFIPLDNPTPENVIAAAEKNLAMRDGFASFFFHPFMELDLLREAVKGIEQLGYRFANVRSLNNRVVGSSCFIASGQNEMKLDLNDQYFYEFYITNRGKLEDHFTSEKKKTEQIRKIVTCPPGWMYVAQALQAKHATFIPNGWSAIFKAPSRIGELWQAEPLVGVNPPTIPLFLIDPNAKGNEAVSQVSIMKAFEAVGIDYQNVSVRNFIEIPKNINLIVIPYAAGKQLTGQQNLFIIRELANGNNVILEKETDLSMRIGIEPFGPNKYASTIRDEYYPQVGIHWKERDTYRNFEVPIEYVTYYSEKISGDPLVIGGEYGEGKYLYITTLFDPTTTRGYGRYPYFCDLLQRQFDLWPLIKKECVEVYFEPGDREDVSVEDLVKMWKRNGFRMIYVAGWHVYQEWTYDYERLIQLGHENGMLVYLWLELPHVGEKFWEDHPEWREITATGQEAMIDWRSLMALSEAACREAVFAELSQMIQSYDWDGVNLAELYFESPLGPDRPDLFTPMHASVRKDFQSKHGFDPIQLFQISSPYFWKKNPKKWKLFQEYRKHLLVEIHRDILGFLFQQKAQKGADMEIVVTALDNVYAKQTGDWTATDTKRLIQLNGEFPFSLQIEDPQELWHLGPFRYDSLSQAYHKILSGNDLILDINVVPFRSFKKSLAPTHQPTGLELYNFIQSAQQENNRVALYSESSIYTVDLPWIGFSLGGQTKETFSLTKWEIESPYTIILNLDPKRHQNVLVDDQLWPAYYEGKMILPAGKHEIRTQNKIDGLLGSLKSTVRLVDISGELKSCKTGLKGMEIVYESDTHNYIVLNEKPMKVFVDEEAYNPEIHHGIPGFSMKLPAGQHTVQITTKSTGTFSLKNFSIVNSIGIVLVSSLAGSVLLILYITGSIRRRKTNHNH